LADSGCGVTSPLTFNERSDDARLEATDTGLARSKLTPSTFTDNAPMNLRRREVPRSSAEISGLRSVNRVVEIPRRGLQRAAAQRLLWTAAQRFDVAAAQRLL